MGDKKGCGIRVLYPVMEWYAVAHPQFENTGWDFNSIMLYPNIKIRPNYANSIDGYLAEDGSYCTNYNVKISPKDVEIIRRLY